MSTNILTPPILAPRPVALSGFKPGGITPTNYGDAALMSLIQQHLTTCRICLRTLCRSKSWHVDPSAKPSPAGHALAWTQTATVPLHIHGGQQPFRRASCLARSDDSLPSNQTLLPASVTACSDSITNAKLLAMRSCPGPRTTSVPPSFGKPADKHLDACGTACFLIKMLPKEAIAAAQRTT